MEIPIQYQLTCEGCKKVLDMRDASILSHGWIEDGEVVCYDEEPVKYTSSKKVDDNVQWTVDKKPMYLN